MNRALLYKAMSEARLLLGACVLLMYAFNWIFVWITSMIRLGPMAEFVKSLPEGIQNLSGVPVGELATVAGRIGMAYVDPVVLLTAAVWGISRGSDVVAGELNRGTMEMLLAQPVRRIAVLLTQSAVAIFGAALIALACFLGTVSGLATVTLEEHVDAYPFVPAAINTFSLIVFLAGTSTLVSACDRYRWRTIGVMGTFFTLNLILNVMARSVKQLNWLEWFTFFGIYEPQGMISRMMTDEHAAWMMALRYDAVLIGLGLASYVGAAVVFCRRDLPAPL